MLHKWQALTLRWCEKTSEIGSERSLTHSKKLAMWLPGRLPLQSLTISAELPQIQNNPNRRQTTSFKGSRCPPAVPPVEL